MKKLLKVALISAALVSTSAMAATQAMKIGVVDAAQVYQDVPQGMATANSMRDSLKPEVDKLTKEQQDLAKQAQELQKNQATMSKADFDKQQKALNDQMQAFQQKYMQVRQEDQQKGQQIAQQFETAFNTSVSEVGKAKHFDLVLVKQAAPYYDSQYDVTSDVIAQMKKDAK